VLLNLCLGGFLVLFWWGFGVPEVQAHKLLVSAGVEGRDAIKVQAFFPDGRPAQETTVEAVSADGDAKVTSLTDSQGACRLENLKPGTYRVAVGDPLGHHAETRVTIGGASLPAAARPAAAPAVPTPPPASTAPATASAPVPAPASPPRPAAPPPAGEEIPWFNILSGLGFIFGLAAFVMVNRLRAEFRRYASRD
jgi:hypothetical protein